MSDISSSAAKTHLLAKSGEIQRVSGDAISKAQIMGHDFLAALGAVASAEATAAGRKTIMASDLEKAIAKILVNACAPAVPQA